MIRLILLLAVSFLFSIHVAAGQAQTPPNPPGTGGGSLTDPSLCDGPCGPLDMHYDEDGRSLEDPVRSGPQRMVRIGLGRPELVVSGPIEEFEAARAALAALGAELLRYRDLPTLAVRFAVFDLHGAGDLALARAALEQAAPNTVIGFHHIYDLSQSRPRVYAATMIGDPDPGACPSGTRRIGLIDGPVDPSHPALSGAHVISESFLTGNERPPAGNHGTAVAALLVGQDPTGALGGFAPGAELYAVSAFTSSAGAPGADIERIATAIEWLLQQDVRLINMSFAGPPNPVLEAVLDRAASRGTIMVAAAGNDGRERAAYPAAHPAVIAVTAVDAAFRRYRDANYGDHIEFSAPGVDLYVASRRSGGGYASGTSYAAPIVTALAARLGAGSGAGLDEIRDRLRRSAVDLGPDGFDSEYGWGLVRGGC